MGLIRFTAGLLAMLAGLYSLLIIIRIILTWFRNAYYSGPMRFLSRITDPYLDWWRQQFNVRAGSFDLSPIIALGALSVAQSIFSAISAYGRITVGIIISICLNAIWSAVSFIIGFCVIVLVLRLIGYLSNSNMYSPFWMLIESISRPLVYRINRIIFGNRIVRYITSLIVTAAVLIGIWIGGKIVIQLLIRLLVSPGLTGSQRLI